MWRYCKWRWCTYNSRHCSSCSFAGNREPLNHVTMNSTDLLENLRDISVDDAGERHEINIVSLASVLGVTVPALVSMLTELEHRDEIIVNISPEYKPGADLVDYNGTVKLMKAPPDDDAVPVQ